MYYRLVSLRSNPTVKINYYQENKFGINLVKMQIDITNSPLVIIVYIDKNHSLIDCMFIEWDVQNAMINHFHIQAQNCQNPKDDHNLLVIP